MNGEHKPGERAPRRVLPILAAAAAMMWAVLLLGPRLAERGSEMEHPTATPMAVPGEPIPAEAGVFRTRPSERAVAPFAERRNQAHRRTLAMARTLRAYPGAPPRIPHGLTYDELRSSVCGTCHERGGWVDRFGAYAPLTPHPEHRNCVQCHVPEDVVVRASAPPPGQNSACLQCHAAGGRTAPFVPIDWRPADWPRIDQSAMPGAPPRIPHDLQMRGNCLACHMAPSGIEEIRTPHPERSNCRQCHVPSYTEEESFTRLLDPAGSAPGGIR